MILAASGRTGAVRRQERHGSEQVVQAMQHVPLAASETVAAAQQVERARSVRYRGAARTSTALSTVSGSRTARPGLKTVKHAEERHEVVPLFSMSLEPTRGLEPLTCALRVDRKSVV